MSTSQGQSILEIVIALSFAAIVILALSRLTVSAVNLYQASSDLVRASQLNREQIEAVYALRLADWHNLFQRSTTTIGLIGSDWQLGTEGQIGQRGKFNYWLEFNPVYRLSDGSLTTPSEQAYLDVLSRQIIAKVSWLDIFSKRHLRQNSILLTAWSAQHWEQTDWSGGGGQEIYQDSHKYWQADDLINTATSGQISLLISSSTSGLASGTLVSSAFSISPKSNFLSLSWRQELPADCSFCQVQAQIKTAADNNGQPGVWSSTWCGPEGDDGDEDDWFTLPFGELIASGDNSQEWIKYRLKLTGAFNKTPTVYAVKIYYE